MYKLYFSILYLSTINGKITFVESRGSVFNHLKFKIQNYAHFDNNDVLVNMNVLNA